MGFMDELRKLTQPYDDEDDFFEGADTAFQPQPTQPAQPATQAQALFESSFADEAAAASQPKPQPPRRPLQKHPAKAAPRQPAARPQAQSEASLFGNLGKKQPPRQGRVNFAGREAQVILFSPRTFDEAGEILNHIRASRSIVMTLEGLPEDTARRLLDFISGIAYALEGKITPVSAKTYFVTPQNVDILASQADQPESDGQYL